MCVVVNDDAVSLDVAGEVDAELACIVVECKAKGVKVCEDTALQVMNYNKHICAEYIIITNGRETYCWRLVENKYIASNIPRFDSL